MYCLPCLRSPISSLPAKYVFKPTAMRALAFCIAISSFFFTFCKYCGDLFFGVGGLTNFFPPGNVASCSKLLKYVVIPTVMRYKQTYKMGVLVLIAEGVRCFRYLLAFSWWRFIFLVSSSFFV